MNKNYPVSFKVFCLIITLSFFIIITSVLFSYYAVDTKYSILLGFLMFITLSFTTVGIYAGFRYTPQDVHLKILNRVGFIGNLVVYLAALAFMVYIVIPVVT